MTSQTRRSENLGPITAVLFDLDDTLIDTARALERLDRYWYRTLPKGRRPANEDGFIDAMFENTPLPGVGLAGIYGRMLEIWPGCFPDVSSAVDAHNRMMPGMIALELSVESMLVDLRAWQVPVGVVTNGFTQTQWSKIRSAGIDRLVKGVVVSEEFGAWKPDPRIFLYALELIGASASETLFVGDNPDADIGGAYGVGMRTAWLRHGRTWGIGSYSPDHILDDVRDVQALVSR